jgi:hypothetical protein
MFQQNSERFWTGSIPDPRTQGHLFLRYVLDGQKQKRPILPHSIMVLRLTLDQKIWVRLPMWHFGLLV